MAAKNNARIVPVNQRSPEQWRVLSKAYDFDGKRVIDVGCGYGDLLLFARAAGATVLGVEQNQEIARSLRMTGVSVVIDDLEAYICNIEDNSFDAALCCSVLPYLRDGEKALVELSRIAKTTFIECQYVGDGPGHIDGDESMAALLERFWSSVKKIGFTEVVIRDMQRSIWMCERGRDV